MPNTTAKYPPPHDPELQAALAKTALDSPHSGLGSIIAERVRQVSEERRTIERDAAYKEDELLRAAVCYILHCIPRETLLPNTNVGLFQDLWPWEMSWWKPGPSFKTALAKAGALVAAHIDVINYLSEQNDEPQEEPQISAADPLYHQVPKEVIDNSYMLLMDITHQAETLRREQALHYRQGCRMQGLMQELKERFDKVADFIERSGAGESLAPHICAFKKASEAPLDKVTPSEESDDADRPLKRRSSTSTWYTS